MGEGVISLVNNWIKKDIKIPNSELVLMKKDKSPVYVFSSHVMIGNANGEKEMFCIDIDISEQKKAEKRIQFLSSVVEQSADGMAIADMEGNILFVNDAWISMHDYESADELLGQNLSIFHNKEQLISDVKSFNRKVMENEHFSGEVGHIRRDGTIFPTQMTTTMLKDKNDNPIAMAGVATDISERKLAEEELAKHHEHLEELVIERTAELEEKNAELERFNKLFIDREFRIKELRDKVKKLEGGGTVN